MARMAGPFVPLPGEIIDLLEPESNASFKYYVLMVSKCYLERVEETGTEWVGAFVQQTKEEIGRKINASGAFRAAIYPRWIEIGLVEERNGLTYIPRSYKKGTDYFSANVMRDEMRELQQTQTTLVKEQSEMQITVGSMAGTISHLMDLLSRSGANAGVQQGPAAAEQEVDIEITPGLGRASALVKPDAKALPRQIADNIISIFYRGIGQSRISGQLRASAQKTIQRLLRDNFTPYQIAIAVDWTLSDGNTREKIRSFGIISNTISQALEAVKKKKEREQLEQKTAEVEHAAIRGREREASDRERMDTLKAELPPKERQTLAERALEDLRSTGLYRESMITQILIGIQENKLLLESAGRVAES